MILNSNITKEMIKNKYVFWDIDGTLTPYRFDGKIFFSGVKCEGLDKMLDQTFFRDRAPSKHMQRIIKECEAKKNIVMGHINNDVEQQYKVLWINTHFPEISEQLYIDFGESKADMMLKYCHQHNIDIKDVIFVDDNNLVLYDAECKGINSWHISSFLDWFED